MKKTVIFALLGMMFLMPEFSQASDNKLIDKSEISRAKDGGRRKKNGSYRKKKGFMWGLFKGKNQCDCPKH